MAKKTATKVVPKEELLDITKLSVQNLAVLNGWEKKQLKVVKDNPYIEITDRSSYEIAKQRRTSLLKSRTELQKSDKLVAKRLREFRIEVGTETDRLISITSDAENKQQDEVTRYEDIKKEEKRVKEEAEEKRVQDINDRITNTKAKFQLITDQMTFETIEASMTEYDDVKKSATEDFDFMEYEILFSDMEEEMSLAIIKRAETLKEAKAKDDENARLQNKTDVQQISIDVSNFINGATDHKTIVEEVESKLDIDNDFGESQADFQEYKTQLLEQAKTRQESLLNAFKSEQKNRVIEVREGLLDKVHQIDIENYTEETNYIKEALSQEVPEYAEEEFTKMNEMVDKALTRKQESVEAEIKEAQRKEEEKAEKLLVERTEGMEEIGMTETADGESLDCFGKMYFVDDIVVMSDDEYKDAIVEIQEAKQAQEEEAQLEARYENRQSELLELGFEFEEEAEQFVENGFYLTESEVKNDEDSLWEQRVEQLKERRAENIKNDKAEQKRQKQLQPDKVLLKKAIEGTRNSLEFDLTKFKLKESTNFVFELQESLDEWCKSVEEKIDNM